MSRSFTKCYFGISLLAFSLVYCLCAPVAVNAASEISTLSTDSTRFRVNQTYFEVYSVNKGWKPLFIKGVNLGAAKPGTFPGELAITQREYRRWLGYIGRMKANTIRVYTAQMPVFYEALFDYNRHHPRRPLYLIQGVWINEDDIALLNDPYADNERIKQQFIADSQAIIDIVHGKAVIPTQTGRASGQYVRDVSQYVIAWLLGIEWDPKFVSTTNINHPDKLSYEGKYIYTEQASPFEVFLGEVADAAISYETSHYSAQRPLSFSNWPTTDMLVHPNEPLANEDMVAVNLEHLKSRPEFVPRLYAAYHIYPYYPDSMNYQHEYAQFVDTDRRIDTYKAYLRDLRKQHTMPVLVAEFGVPSSRGMAHRNIYMGFNQGNITEQQQGDMDADMLKDIHDESYAGGLVFSWQDEWFKRTWNTMDLDMPDRRPYWSNTQTNEQGFGLLAFDPGQKAICQIDGSLGEWRRSQPIYSGNGVRLHAKSDEKYLYLMAEVPGFDFDQDTLVVMLDTLENQGSAVVTQYGMTFTRAADFVISVHGQDDSRISVEAYYDPFYFLYAKLTSQLDQDPNHEVTGNNFFVPLKLSLNRQLYLPQDQQILPFSSYETGKLQYGDGNPRHAQFNSLSDFAFKRKKFEIRISWQLLNVMDPSSKQIIGNLYARNAIAAQPATGFHIGAGVAKPGGAPQLIGSGEFDWEPWQQPAYHERVKRSYYRLRKAFNGYR